MCPLLILLVTAELRRFHRVVQVKSRASPQVATFERSLQVEVLVDDRVDVPLSLFDALWTTFVAFPPDVLDDVAFEKATELLRCEGGLESVDALDAVCSTSVMGRVVYKVL